MSNDFLHMIKRGLTSEFLQIFRKSVGNLSGPAATVDEICSVTSLTLSRPLDVPVRPTARSRLWPFV